MDNEQDKDEVTSPATPAAIAEAEKPIRDPAIYATTDGKPPRPGCEGPDAPAPGPVGPDGQHAAYWILSEAERAKGFVRPVRRSYKHVGLPAPKGVLRDLNERERELYGARYAKYEDYPEEMRPAVGRFWTQVDIDKIGKGCGTITSMGPALAETYARDPHFYNATFCCGCGTHLPVGERGEFVWIEMGAMGGYATEERVGT